MSDSSARSRAEFVAQMAPHPSVSADVLADEEDQFDDARLVGQPPVSYLEGSEAPAYVLTNAKRGVAVGTKRNKTKPDKGRGTVVLVTGRRTLLLVGTSPEDTVIEVPHTDAAAVSYETGWLASRLELRTPQRAYHWWVGRNTTEDLLDATAEYIEERLDADPEELVPAEEAGDVTYRGEPVNGSPSKNGSEKEEEKEEEEDDSTVMYRGQPVDKSFLE